MDLDFTPAERDFRAEARAWLRENVPPRPLPSMDTPAGFEAHRAWERRLAAARLSAVSWPEEYGGRGASLVEWLIFEEEYWAAGAPGRVSQNGVFLLAPTLFAFGTPDQRARLLPRMAAADDIWAQAWSEPEAGSDLAALRSRAVRAEGGWRLYGHKTWSSRAAYADWAFGLFRTDPAAPRHRGLTYLMFPLTGADGVTVRPIAQLGGGHGFAEILLDGLYVPDDLVLGAPGDGWRIAMATTSSERGLTLRSPGRFLATADRLVRLARHTGADPALADEVARAWLDAEAYRLHTFATARRIAAGEEIGPAASMGKVFWSELDVRMHRLAQRLLGERGLLSGAAPDAADGGRWLDGFLFSLAGPIYAGTNEIQRTIIAERVLGLPR
ncbi:alkylation response protein AidB-like acyl-CoA dehydrogenase [Thermocatellispora tengchongensis]|uniref:Alkylation response protein AidB-like acyl-CoA dehydrogenase n=1 Tax=Thermocatellispora tengchongensis TaxID=1073253 RepID=A0A840P7T6_9ACTN|nr:acyl-CoA dehydrogenase family protein [Thermocatellispora tengchongensis]MBB5133277.1 alkylation response protein AidB-like acyl-CoA dehydrogenase [Thermocatellispora tengchongensis]